jgi:hypothetical protein
MAPHGGPFLRLESLCILTASVMCSLHVSLVTLTPLRTPLGQQWTAMQVAGREEHALAEVRGAFALMNRAKVHHPPFLSLTNHPPSPSPSNTQPANTWKRL